MFENDPSDSTASQGQQQLAQLAAILAQPSCASMPACPSLGPRWEPRGDDGLAPTAQLGKIPAEIVLSRLTLVRVDGSDVTQGARGTCNDEDAY